MAAAFALRLKDPRLPALPVISVIDDDESVRVSLVGLVRSLGWKVRAFASAEAFLDSDARGASDCVISDVHMPGGIDGVALKEALVATGDKTPVILISAFADDQLHARAGKAGALCLLRKPFDGSRLIDCLNGALGL